MSKPASRVTRVEPFHAAAAGGSRGDGGDNRQPPRVAAAGAPKPPRWTLTEEFNKAAKKPESPARTMESKRQIDELRKQMEAATKGTGQDNNKRSTSRVISSKQGIEALRQKKMSQPRNTWEMTPLGSVNRGYNPQRDRKISKEIARQQAVLDKSQGKAKAAFDRSSGIGR